MTASQAIHGRAIDQAVLLASALFHDRTIVLEALAGVIALAVGGWWAATVWSKRQSQRPHRNPQRLFAALCSAHRLDRNQRRLLAQLAEFHRLSQPGALLVQPERFRPANLEGFPGNRQEVQQLEDRLFGIS